MKKLILLALLCTQQLFLRAQEIDSTRLKELLEIVIISKKNNKYSTPKPLGSIDNYLQTNPSIDLIKRGAYASEPLLNNLSSERTVVTIDGMRIFGACTDKMDPITSYVEISNLKEANVTSGQQGSQHGATIGGSINLVRNTFDYTTTGWKGTAQLGYETNQQHKIIGAGLLYGNKRFFAKIDAMFRDAENYTTGKNQSLQFTQFTKFNLGASAGVKLNRFHQLSANLISDRGMNIGYASLPMDVSLAQAWITSFQHSYKNDSAKIITEWTSKIYWNSIVHIMDDTKRPAVPIHMDMPGKSQTSGFLTTALMKKNAHDLTVTMNGFYNYSTAEMTMYPPNSSEALMFMYTWPNVHTYSLGVFAEDRWKINHHASLRYSLAISTHTNTLRDSVAIKSIALFHPSFNSNQTRILPNAALAYTYAKNRWEWTVSTGYGHRAPSISEGYGFYLFNSYDRYDYIGNPSLKNEKSANIGTSLGKSFRRLSIKVQATYFHFQDYIVGKIHSEFYPMTIGSDGVKMYEALPTAHLLTGNVVAEYSRWNFWKWRGQVVYAYGRDQENQPLPLISPIRYRTSVHFDKKRWKAEVNLQGNSHQQRYNPYYGETPTASWAILGLSASYEQPIKSTKLTYTFGIENLTNTYYTTYSDWNKIPRMGRNFFLHLSLTF